MKKNTKRILALLLAVCMVAALAACGPQDDGPVGGAAWGEDGKPFTKDTTIKITVSSHASYPYDANWKMWQYFMEGSGATIDVDAVIGTDYNTKVNLMVADSKSFPDLMDVPDKALLDKHAASGAFIAIDDHMDEMPNYTAALNAIDENVREGLLRERRSADAKHYQPVVLGTSTVANAQGWLYREDIFKKHGLKSPETFEDLYNVCKKLKELYPDSYPLVLQSGMGAITRIGPSFKPYLDYGVYYDFNAEKWCYGAMEEEMKELVKWLIMMRKEGLIQPTVYSMDGTAYDEYITNDKTFITSHYLVRQSYYNVPMKKTNPEFSLVAMVPPRADIPTGQNKMAKTSIIKGGLAIPNTKDKNRIANAVRLLDWMYSEDAVELLSWGKEGETYQINADGNKEYILDAGETVQLKYGFATSGLLQSVKSDAYNEAIASGSPIDPAIFEYTEDNVNPLAWISFNDEEQAIYNQYYDAVFNYTCEFIDKFALGTEEYSDEAWDAAVSRLEELGVNEVLKIFESAWQRVK